MSSVHRLWLFLKSAGWQGISLMTGGLASYCLGGYEHLVGHSVSATVWAGMVATALFMAGAFLAWNDQYSKAILAGNPEVFVSYDKDSGQAPPSIVIQNLGGGNAYRVKIRDIQNADAVAEFDEIACLPQKQTCTATATIRETGLVVPVVMQTFERFLKGRPPTATSPPEAIEQMLTPHPVRLVVDYSNVTDMKFSAEFDIRYTYAWDKATTHFVRRYFNQQ